MNLRRRQRGFLLNPFRFAGTTQSGAMSVSGAESVVTMAGAAVGSMTLSSIAEAGIAWDSGQATSGALSMIAESVATMVGASIASAPVSSTAEALATFQLAPPSLTVDAADFDGTNDDLGRATLTAQANSKSGIFSVWLRPDALANVNIFDGLDTGVFSTAFNMLISNVAAGDWDLLLLTTAGATVIDYRCTAGGRLTTGAWQNILCSWDASTTTLHMYRNDVDAKGAGIINNAEACHGIVDEWSVGDFSGGGGGRYDGGMAELYFAPGQYIDLSVEANRRKFISATGKPVDLGSTGATPTGTAPLVYLHLSDGETANNFAVNRGTGGNFTVTGALGTYASSPSD